MMLFANGLPSDPYTGMEANPLPEGILPARRGALYGHQVSSRARFRTKLPESAFVLGAIKGEFEDDCR
jgi:hypothetical protein